MNSNFIGIITESILKNSHYSSFVEYENTKFILKVSLEEKSESDESVEIEHPTIKNILKNLYLSDKTKLVINFYVILQDEYFFMALINAISIGLLKSGLEINDVMVSYCKNDLELVYLIHSNNVAYLKAQENISETFFDAINICNKIGEDMKEFTLNTIFSSVNE